MRGLIAFALLAAASIAGCGGGERQDADEPRGEYRLEVTRAEFPSEQRLAERSSLVVAVRNDDSKTVPNVALTVRTAAQQEGGATLAFGQRSDDPDLADPGRPVWIVDAGPEGGDTAYANTWALGALRPGETKTFEWRVTAVQAGDYTVNYEVAPGLDGRARLARDSSQAKGSFRVSIDDEPAQARVDADGNVVRTDEEE